MFKKHKINIKEDTRRKRWGKVQFFWEGHKNLRNLPHGFDIYLVNIKTMRKIAQIFVAFSEKLNFTIAIQIKHKQLFVRFFVRIQ